LKSSRIFCMLEWLESIIRRILSTYLQYFIIINYNYKLQPLSGIYKLICPDCNKTYVGQTGRQFTTHYKEHNTAFHHNSNTSSFVKDLVQEAQSFGPMNNIMQIIH
jgi:hypothetical protein